MDLRLKGFQYLDLLPVVTGDIKKTCQGMHVSLDLHSEIEHFLDSFLSTSTSTEWNPGHTYPLLPLFCCEAAYGDPVQAIPVSAAWMAFYFAAHLLDAVEDDEPPKYPAASSGKAGTINLSTGLIMAAELTLDALEDHGIDQITARVVRTRLHKTIFEMCAGQHLDLQKHNPGIHACLEIAAAKSGSFFSAACYSGAILAMDDPGQLNCFSSYGYQLGMIVQIEDDIADFWDRDGRNNDLARGKWSLPVAYALEVLPAEETHRLKELLVEARTDRAAEQAARQTILAAGAILFLDLEVKKHYRLAEIAMRQLRLSPSGRQTLQDILDWLTIQN
jgi:geranylgeranyl diphosphate synthase type I